MGLKKLLTQSIIWRSFYFFSILLINVFLSRYLQAAGTGNLYFLTIIFTFVQLILSLSADSSVIYFASGNIVERNKLITLSGVWSLVAGILMSGVVYAYFFVDASADKTLINWYCVFGFLYVCGQSLTNYSVAIYYTKENYFLPNFLLGAVNIIYVLFIPGAKANHDSTHTQWLIFFYFFTFFISGVLVFLSYVIQYKKEGAMRFPESHLFRQIIRYSLTALGANAVFFLVYRVDYLFVNYSPVCTTADLGNYIQVSKLGQMMLVVPQIIAGVVFPRTASGIEPENLNKAIITIARILSQLFLLMFVVVAILGKQIFTLVFGETFNKMQLPMLILIPGIFSLSLLALLSAYFGGKGKIKINLYAAIIGLIVMIIGDFIFVPRYGIIAAAAISTLSYLANTGYSMWHFHKDFSIKWFEFFKWRKEDYNWLFSFFKINKAEE